MFKLFFYVSYSLLGLLAALSIGSIVYSKGIRIYSKIKFSIQLLFAMGKLRIQSFFSKMIRSDLKTPKSSEITTAVEEISITDLVENQIHAPHDSSALPSDIVQLKKKLKSL
jgi:hypothetical protein